MTLVVDTSIIISVITNEAHKKKIIKLTKGEELIAPISLHYEIANAFSVMFKRNRISLDDAKLAIEYYAQIPLRLVEVDLVKALEIAVMNNIYAYDAFFIECAKRFNAKIMSLDKGVIITAKENNINVIEV